MAEEFRYEQIALGRPQRVDREKGELIGVRVMGIKSAHGYEYTLGAQRQAAARYEQMKLGIDHDYSGGPLTAENTWGVLFNPSVDDKGTLADVRFLKSHARTEQILEDCERNLGVFALSAVTTGCVQEPKGSITSFTPVRCDVVVGGATTHKMFEQAAQVPVPATSQGSGEEIKVLREQNAALQTRVSALEAKQLQFEQAAVNKAQTAAAVATVTAPIDLKKFWND